MFGDVDCNVLRLNGADIVFDHNKPYITSGGFGDLFIGTHYTKGRVALKRLKSDDTTQREHFMKEALTWSTLSHPSILPFFGVLHHPPSGHSFLVSPFMQRGSVLQYLKREPGANRFKLIYEIADGLAYLHERGIIHGDIKGANVVVSAERQAMLCDFGLSKAVGEATDTSMAGFGSIRWQAPELFDNASRTTKSDVYAFGITIAEILSGKPPYHDILSHGAMVLAIFVLDKRPPRTPSHAPTGDSYEPLWALAERCWAKDPEARPLMREVFDTLAPATAYTPTNFEIIPLSNAYTLDAMPFAGRWPAHLQWQASEILTNNTKTNPADVDIFGLGMAQILRDRIPLHQY